MTTPYATINDPEFYIALLSFLSPDAERISTSNPLCFTSSYMPKMDLNHQLAKPLKDLLDTLAKVMSSPGNPAAVAASIGQSSVNGSLNTSIYYAFNSATEVDIARTQKYLSSMLTHIQESNPPRQGANRDVHHSTIDLLVCLIKLTHEYCWESFEKHVNKRLHLLQPARQAVEDAPSETLTSTQRETFIETFNLIDRVVGIVRQGKTSFNQRDCRILFNVYIKLKRLTILTFQPVRGGNVLLKKLDEVIGEILTPTLAQYSLMSCF
jgi:hypothetical protein